MQVKLSKKLFKENRDEADRLGDLGNKGVTDEIGELAAPDGVVSNKSGGGEALEVTSGGIIRTGDQSAMVCSRWEPILALSS